MLVSATAIIAACTVAPDAPDSPPEPRSVLVESQPATNDVSERDKAHELVGTGEWINSEPLDLLKLRGKVVLLDFWTYTCVNCIRTLPHLKEWYDKYDDHGLVIIGVHSPEFRFERDPDNLRQAVADYGIEWPVVQDNEHQTWDAYNNVVWPSKYLIDRNGVVRQYYGGEGGYDETASLIEELIAEDPADTLARPDPPDFNAAEEIIRGLDSFDSVSSDDETLDATFRNTPGAEITSELYLGYARGCERKFFANSEIDDPRYCDSKNMVATYDDLGTRETHSLYLHGVWLAAEDNLRHARNTDEFEDYVTLRFAAKSVSLVIQPDANVAPRFLVTLDGEYLNDSNKGADIVIEPDGRSFLVADSPKMFHLIESPSYGIHDLKISTDSNDFGLYTFTFGVNAKGP